MTTGLKRTTMLFLTMIMIIVGAAVTAVVTYADTFYTIKVEYHFENGDNAHDPYVAVLREGEDLDVEVTNPVIPGYKAMTSPDDDAEEARTTSLKYTNICDSDTVTVYYLPDKVHYKARYFLQNIYDDLYTEDLSLSNDMYEKSGYTGTYPAELEAVSFDGFTSLFHEPDVIAADGSTEFKLYFDRNYYLISFDLGEGGYGVEPVYAKQGSAFNIAAPKRMGYSFLGWVKSNEKGEYLDNDGNVITEEEAKTSAVNFTSGIVPIGNTYYKAVWKPENTHYSIAYWVERPGSTLTDEELAKAEAEGKLDSIISKYYTVLVTKNFDNVPSGTTVNYDEMTEEYDFFGDNVKSLYSTMSEAQKKEIVGKQRYFNLNRTLTHAQFAGENLAVAGDGSTRINMYYDRKPITMQFFYAKEEADGKIYLTYGTKGFSNSEKPTLAERVYDAGWGKNVVSTLPQIAGKYRDKLTPKYLPDASGKKKYWYYEVKANYGADISGLWYNDAIEPQLRKDRNGDDTQYARFGSWAVENGSKYKEGRGNFTVKGRFDKLNEEVLLTDSWLDSHPNVDPTELHFVASWMNTGNIKGKDWNDGAKRVYNFTYKNYTELLEGEVEEIAANGDGGQSLIDSGLYTDIILNKGVYYGLKAENIIETFDSGKQYTDEDNGDLTKSYRGDRAYAIFKNQTPISISGFTLQSAKKIEKIDENSGTWNPQSFWKPSTLDLNSDGVPDFDADHHADVCFFYTRNEYVLTFVNNNQKEKVFDSKTLAPHKGVAYGAPFNRKISSGELAGQYAYWYTPEYYNQDLKDYYRFDGWYFSPYFVRRVDRDSNLMPADDTTLYARWVPITCDVTFYNDYRSYSLNNVLHKSEVDYGSLINTSEVPADEEGAAYTLNPPSRGALFAGWYYIDRNHRPVRFDPETLPVTRELKLYAEWVSKDTAKYKITYTEQGTGKEVAPPTKGTAFVSKTRTFIAKNGSELNDEHKWIDGEANWWPVLSSHSVMIEPNRDGKEFEPNEFNFEYIKKSKVWYRVVYINAETGATIYEAKDVDTAYAAVTEHAQYVKGYVPDKLSRSIVLSASVNSDEEAAKREELRTNVITFLYTPSESGTLYQIDHYIQNLDNPTSFDLYHSETQTAVIGDNVTTSEVYNRDLSRSLLETGFIISDSLSKIEVTDGSGNTTVVSGDNVTLDGNVTVISVYYLRNSYRYTVEYYDYEAAKLHNENPDLWDGEIKAPDIYDPEPVGKVVGIEPPETIAYSGSKGAKRAYDNYTRISDRQLTVTIRPDSDTPVTNIIKVYYKKDSQRKLTYEIYCPSELTETIAAISQSQELVENKEQITGCTVTPVDESALQGSYTFVGWFTDPLNYKNEKPLSESYTCVPEFPGADMTFYAIFEQDTVRMNAEVRFNDSGVYTSDETSTLDVGGLNTGYDFSFAAPYGYESGSETPLLKHSNFKFTLNKLDNKMYKYTFAGWYEVLENGEIIKHEDRITSTIEEVRNRNYRYIAMFGRVELRDEVNYEIRYRFKTRTNGIKDYIESGTLSGDSLTKSLNDSGAYELNNTFIMKKAPFESNNGELLNWTDKGITRDSDNDSNTMYTVVVAEQTTKKVVVNYKLPDSDSFKVLAQITYGANYKTDSNLKKLVAPEEYDGKKFSYWAIRKSADESSDIIARCYDNLFSYCMMDNYWITAVYSDAPEEDVPAEHVVTLKHIGNTRNRWTDVNETDASKGNTDRLYMDFEAAFADSSMTIPNGGSCRVGLVYEICATVPSDVTFDSNKDYNVKSDSDNLKAAIVNNSSVYVYNKTTGKRRSIIVDDVSIGELTNKNRIQAGLGLRNNYTVTVDGEKETKTYKNANYLVKVTAYYIENGEVTLSNSVYACLRDVSEKSLVAIKGDDS